MECVYCEKGERLESFTIRLGEMKSSILYLQKEQSYYGRCLLVYKSHVEEIFELSQADWRFFMDDVYTVAETMHTLYKPDKINCGMFGDTVRHLHAHLVPKRKDQLDWNSTFQLNANKTFLTGDEYAEMVVAYTKALNL